MKTSAVILLGLCAVFAFIANAQGGEGKGKGKGKGGWGKGCDGMKFSEEDKNAMAQCKPNKDAAEGTGEGGKGKGKGMGKMAKCMMDAQGYVKDGKFNPDAYNAGVDKRYESPDASQKVKDAFKACCDKDGLWTKTYSSEKDYGGLMKCSWKAMKAGCSKKSDEGGDE